MLRLPSLALSVAVAAFSVAGASADNPQIPPPGATVFVPPPPPGELVDVGGRKLHILCKGSGPSVIIEAGLSQFTASSSYGKALDAIAPFAHVCLYDRAGLGWSDPAPLGRTHRDMVEDLHRLLRAAHLKGPHILVGHSMGGLLVRLYAHLYPREVAGIVLADSSTEEDLFAPGAPADRAALVAKITDGLKVSKPHVPMVQIPAGTVADAFIAFTPETFTALRDEYQAIDRAPQSMRGPAGYGTLGNVPLTSSPAAACRPRRAPKTSPGAPCSKNSPPCRRTACSSSPTKAATSSPTTNPKSSPMPYAE